MTIQNGLPRNRRVHARNYIPDEAQARFDECIAPYQQQGLNALGVDYFEVELYLKSLSSRVCTCKEIIQDLPEMDVGTDEKPQYEGISREQPITIDWAKPLFGEPNENTFHDNDEGEQDDDAVYDLDGDELGSPMSQVVESAADCGICYRTGFVPGFERYGQTRFVLTTQDFIDVFATHVDRSKAPHTIEVYASGWVAFQIAVPKYFKSVTYSVRNGFEVLNEKLWFGEVPLTLGCLKQFAGKTLTFRVRARHFTHVVITFDLGSDPIHANIAQMSKVTDWTLFETLANLNVILPMTVPEMPVGSLLIVPKRNLGLRIVDVPYLRTAGGHNLDWSVNTRVLQPQEPLKAISKGFKLL